MNDLRKFAADKAAALVEKHRKAADAATMHKTAAGEASTIGDALLGKIKQVADSAAQQVGSSATGAAALDKVKQVANAAAQQAGDSTTGAAVMDRVKQLTGSTAGDTSLMGRLNSLTASAADSPLIHRLKRLVASGSAGVNERLSGLSPEMRRVVLTGGAGAGLGGLLGLQGAIGKKDAERSRLMDMLRGATAGGLAGGGVAMGYNALTGSATPEKMRVEGVGEIDPREAVKQIDAARSGEPGPILNAANNFGQANSMVTGTAGGAAIGGAAEAYDALSPSRRTSRFLEELSRLAKDGPTGLQPDYQKLYAKLHADNRLVPGLMKEIRKHQTPGAFGAFVSKLQSIFNRNPTGGQGSTRWPANWVKPPNVVDPIRQYIDNTLGATDMYGKPAPFLSPGTTLGRDSFKPLPGGTPRPARWKTPAAGALAGGTLAGAALLAPTVASLFPSQGLSNEQVLDALRKGN